MQPLEDMQDGQPPQSPQEFVAYVTASVNLATDIEEAELQRIAQQVMADYEIDKRSMAEWFDRMEKGIDLAKLVKEEKSYPFDKAANIKYPLITSAALQFNARAYPAIVAPDRPVKARVWGSDPQGTKAARAERISEHMSWQLAAQVTEWEEETDKLLVQLPIVGTMIRKWWFDRVDRRPKCKTLEPGSFIVNSKVKVLSEAPRCTEEMSLYPSDIEERKRSGSFVADFEPDTTGEDENAPQEFIEQHTLLDLDGDEYPEPYVVTVHKDSGKVVRIVADFEEQDVSYKTEVQPVQVNVPQQMMDYTTGEIFMQSMPKIQPQEVIVGISSVRRGSYYTAHQFLPSMDGSFWGTGLGILLGDISEAINSIINMMMDSGHYSSLGGGFIGSEFRIKGGAQRMKPGEWRKVEARGSDIRAAVVPMQFKGADATLFQLLGMLIDAGREIASVQNVITGEAPRQQQTATTTLALIEQGMMVFTAAYKRIFRACAQEYRILASINAKTITPEDYNQFHDDQQPYDPAVEYASGDMDIQPVADPRNVTKMQQAAKAQLVMQLAEQGMIDPQAAMARIAEAMDIEDVEELLPQPDPMAQQLQQMQLQSAQADLAQKMADVQLTLAKVREAETKAVENLASATSEKDRAENERMKIEIEAVRVALEDERKRISEVLAGVGRMADRANNPNAQRPNGAAIQIAQISDAGSLVPGEPGGGSGPEGFNPFG